MAEKIYDKALTTVQRVKDRIGIATGVTGHDVLLARIINSATDFIEGSLNRNLKKATYTEEVYSIKNDFQKDLFLKNFPVVTLTKLQYASGTPSNKTWIDYIADDYEIDSKEMGSVKVYGILPKGVNTVRATYDAGYLIDFTKAGDLTYHNLPADLTDLCERMVVKVFKKRDNEGKDTESFNGANTTWEKGMSADDKETLNGYKRMMFV